MPSVLTLSPADFTNLQGFTFALCLLRQFEFLNMESSPILLSLFGSNGLDSLVWWKVSLTTGGWLELGDLRS